VQFGFAHIPGIGQIPFSLQPVDSHTDRSTAATIAAMRTCILEAAYSPAVIQAMRQALGPVGLGAPAWRKAQAIWEWMRRNVRFVPDEDALARYFGMPDDVELLQRPELLLLTRRGDCDCFTMLTCAMLAAAGVDYRIVTVKADPQAPDRWSHVYAAAITEQGDEIPMDTSHGRVFGWEVPADRVYARAEWAC
jgi:transglutaminase-like putative cysteine protease